jgi:hypothetical protein
MPRRVAAFIPKSSADGQRTISCCRHNGSHSTVDGAFFIENRSTQFGFGAKHTAIIRYTTDRWATINDVECVTTQLAAFDAVHR